MPTLVSNILDAEEKLLSTSLGTHFPTVWDRASGATVWNVNGEEYIDLTSGICITNLGHCHPKVTSALSAQLQTLMACYEFPHPLRSKYAERLLATLPFPNGRIHFKTTGGEAIDTAMLLAQFVTGRSEFLSYQGGFHGGTFGALAATGERKYKEGFAPAERVHFVPYPYSVVPSSCALAAKS